MIYNLIRPNIGNVNLANPKIMFNLKILAFLC